jgi:hypothetical protein
MYSTAERLAAYRVYDAEWLQHARRARELERNRKKDRARRARDREHILKRQRVHYGKHRERTLRKLWLARVRERYGGQMPAPRVLEMLDALRRLRCVSRGIKPWVAQGPGG